MLPRDLFRTEPEAVRAMLSARRTEAPLDRLLEVDGNWRHLVMRSDELRALRNAGSKEVGELFRTGQKEKGEAKRVEMAAIGDEIKALEEQSRELEEELLSLELTIPNRPDPSVPVGVSEADNPVERSWGDRPNFDFKPQPHWDLGPQLGILDFERAAKISGARFVVLSGIGAALERALVSYMLDLQTRHHGYTEVLPPYMVSSSSLTATGQLPKFGDDLFHAENTDLYLIPTAEVPVTNLHREETLAEETLPLRYCAFSPCFRAEAGSYGKDVRGLIRLHQFHKVELVEFTTPESSAERLEAIAGCAEAVLQGLGLSYRVVSLCTGDLGFSAAKTYDLEVWLPALETYREISSCSNFTDFQARRARIRYKPADGGRPRLVHTLNGSALAVGRTMVAILENYQQKNGSIVVPEVLRPYLHGLEVIEPSR